jgi:hypothetical protein
MNGKLTLLAALLIAALLAACQPITFEEYPTLAEKTEYIEETETPAETQSAGDGQQGNIQISTELKLLIGTFRLKGTNLEVTKDQAKELVPLWAMALMLQSSMTSKLEDIQVNTSQIQAVMTPAQLKAIDAMNLTYEDMFTLMDELNIDYGYWGPHDHDETPQPGEDATPTLDQELTPTDEFTTPAATNTPAFPGGRWDPRWEHMVPPDLLNALIPYLQGIK